MKILFYLILLFFLISSCDKDISIANGVTGTVLDKTTNIAVSEAEVGLFEKDSEIFGGLGGVLLETKYSDADGSFHFDFTEREGYNYYVQAIKDQYFNDQSNNITYVHSGNNDATVYLQPEGYLLLNIINEVPSSIHDIISLNTPQGYDDGPFYGGDIDTSIIIITYGNTENEIVKFIYYNESLISQETLLIFTPSFDTTYFEILY